MSKYSGLFSMLKMSPKYFFRVLKCEHNYRTFRIKKKGGGWRQITAPEEELLEIQKKFLRKLEELYVPTRAAHGFTLERSVRTNALDHVGKAWVLNVDIKDFFPTISEKRVWGALYKWKKFRQAFDLSKKEIYLLAKLCCHKKKLPQGAPTSPFLSNLVARALDKQLLDFSFEHNLHYSRYCDDISFSPRLPGIEPASVFQKGSQKVSKGLRAVFLKNGFKLNPSKTRLQTHPRPMRVTGLVVNATTNLPRKWIRQLRAMISSCERQEEPEQPLTYSQKCGIAYLHMRIWGKLQYLSMIRGKGDPIYIRLRKRFLKFRPYKENSLKVELDDFRRRADLEALLREERERAKSKGFSAISFLKSWVEERIDYLVCGTENLRKSYLHETISEMVYVAEMSYLKGQLQEVSDHRESFTHYLKAWDRLTSAVGDEMGKEFHSLSRELEEENHDLKEKLKEFWKSQGIPFGLRGRKGTFDSIWQASGDPAQRRQGLGVLILFVALAKVNGDDPKIRRQRKRYAKVLEIDPQFGEHFNRLRKIRNSDKRRTPSFEEFREGFYRAWRLFGVKLR
jgi:hypothetical protein